jgi:hypothetical protein
LLFYPVVYQSRDDPYRIRKVMTTPLEDRVSQLVMRASVMEHALYGHDVWAVRFDGTDYPARVDLDDDITFVAAIGIGTGIPILLRNGIEVLYGNQSISFITRCTLTWKMSFTSLTV